jgi:ATP-dependent helicase/nuclease subunit B
MPVTPADSDPPDSACWHRAMLRLAAVLEERAVHPRDAVVLLPYAQLMPQAKQAWARQHATGGSFFVPRIETTLNWAGSLGHGAFLASGDDLRHDIAVDMLTAASLLGRVGLAEQQDMLAARLVEAAWSLAGVAAAVKPAERAAWGERLGTALSAGLESSVLAYEAAIGRIALAWVANSAYATDRLFDADPALLAVIEGFQSEPLTAALRTHFTGRSISIALCRPEDLPAAPQLPALHAALDAEDEAGRAAACVLAQLAAGHAPVALIAQDRLLTRRVGAMLAERGVPMRDETGWKLSTTRAAAGFMSLLRAMAWDASTDALLDWLKNAPAFEPATVTATEIELRRAGLRAWRDLPASESKAFAAAQQLAPAIDALRAGMSRPRTLALWLRELRGALQAAGQWNALAGDVAGQKLLDTLRLHEGAEAEFSAAPVMNQQAFTAWVSQALESASFRPPHPRDGQVVILPLAQLLGRSVQAVVLPGCDEIRLPVSPEPSGHWTPTQRELLGLPSRAALAEAQRQAWRYALQQPRLELLWRGSEGGEHLIPSGFVQELLLEGVEAPAMAADPRAVRAVEPQPTAHPMPNGQALPVGKLSASAYEDLRRCPYRFFALRQLRLKESDELDSELGKRDFGNWLHSLLKVFHEELLQQPSDDQQVRSAMLDDAAEVATQELALSESEFLPFAAIWPRVREGYLSWLTEHEASGTRFESAEVDRETMLGPDLKLIGRLDRIDRQASGEVFVMDYKTEARTVTAERIKDGQEDTQLAFYAALMADDTLAAAYVNLGEKESTRTYDQPEIVGLRDELIDSILTDMARIARGTPLPALGEGKACEYCAARGLCRKDFWHE